MLSSSGGVQRKRVETSKFTVKMFETGGHEGLVLETRSTNQGKISTKSLGCSFYKHWWLDDCSSCGCLAFGAVFRGGDCFGSKKDDCWWVPDADLCWQHVSQVPIKMIISVTSQCFIYLSRHAPCMVHLPYIHDKCIGKYSIHGAYVFLKKGFVKPFWSLR